MGARNIAIIKLWSSEGTTTGLGARSTRVIPTGKFPATISAKSRHVLHALLAKPPFTRLFAVFCNPLGLACLLSTIRPVSFPSCLGPGTQRHHSRCWF